MKTSLEGWPNKDKEAASAYEVRLTPLDTNQYFNALEVTILFDPFIETQTSLTSIDTSK